MSDRLDHEDRLLLEEELQQLEDHESGLFEGLFLAATESTTFAQMAGRSLYLYCSYFTAFPQLWRLLLRRLRSERLPFPKLQAYSPEWPGALGPISLAHLF
ncbi:unnamed protein product [Effrenium voratum]|uniref:Uncharacterized protein n=1 Tax=Effrenium voratum TaxID=2562239 RepID=A0AA36I6C5_9DINO|nr:unnamed protein product [Effrenium voratum]